MRRVDPCGHGLFTVVSENFDAVFIQQDAELERTVLAAHLAAAAVNDVGTGTGIAAIQRQLGGVGVVGQAGVMVCIGGQLQGEGAVFAGLYRDGQIRHTALDPYRSAFQVYCDKNSETIENIDNEAMRQGRDLEDYVAQRFTETTGLKVRRANAIYQSEEHPLLLADFDRLIVGQKAGLECKTVSPFSADKWADGKIPAHYMAQVNHYLAVSGFDCWYIAALIFGKELVIHKITTDKEVLNNLIAKEEHFWKYNVMPEIPPVPTGSEGDTQQINQLYSADDRNKTADLNSIRDLLDKRQELSDQIEQMEQEKMAIEQQVKLQMQDAAYGIAPGYKVSWVSSESKRVDSQRLKKEQPDIFNRYSKNVSSRRFTIIHAA